MFSVCAAGLELEDGLCLDPNRPRRYKLKKRDTTLTTTGTMVNSQVRVHIHWEKWKIEEKNLGVSQFKTINLSVTRGR